MWKEKKFGMNMQAVCDNEKRFIDIDISKTGSTSDYMVFCTSSLLQKLQTQGFLKKVLTLYGDAAYVNCDFMTAPFKGVGTGVKDAFNFYQSQLRINIECAFGMLVHKFGCLQKPLPGGLYIKKSLCW